MCYGLVGVGRRGRCCLLLLIHFLGLIFALVSLGFWPPVICFVKAAPFEDDSPTGSKEPYQPRLTATRAFRHGRCGKRLPLLEVMVTGATGIFVSGHWQNLPSSPLKAVHPRLFSYSLNALLL